jgi:hypothetical protein
MPRQRFLAIWLCFGLLYLVLAAVGPNGLSSTWAWPQVNQHLLQVRAWLGDDIAVPESNGNTPHTIAVAPRLDVTPYFSTWVLEDPRERVLLSNIACGVRSRDGSRRLEPVQYVGADTVLGRLQLDRLVIHVGSPLGPALVMLPLRLIFGRTLAVQWLGPMLGGLAVAMMDLLLFWWLTAIRGDGSVPWGERARLVALAGLGTLWIWLVPLPEVWFFAQTVATTALTASLVLAWRRHWLLAGAAFAIAITSRPPTALAMPLLLAILLMQAGPSARLRGPSRMSKRRALALALLVPVALGAAHLALNAVRFGSPLEFGYRFMLTPPELRQALAQWGPFNPVFLSTNVHYLLLQPPITVVDEAGRLAFPFVASDPHGMGVLFVTPAFVGILLAFGRNLRSRGLVAACWLCLVLVTLPPLFHFNTGWVQWGGRYLLDAWPMWLMLASIGLGRMNRRLAAALVVLSVIGNVWAAVSTAAGWWP